MLGLRVFSYSEVNSRLGVEGILQSASLIVSGCVERHTVNTRCQLQTIAEASSPSIRVGLHLSKLFPQPVTQPATSHCVS